MTVGRHLARKCQLRPHCVEAVHVPACARGNNGTRLVQRDRGQTGHTLKGCVLSCPPARSHGRAGHRGTLSRLSPLSLMSPVSERDARDLIAPFDSRYSLPAPLWLIAVAESAYRDRQKPLDSKLFQTVRRSRQHIVSAEPWNWPRDGQPGDGAPFRNRGGGEENGHRFVNRRSASLHGAALKVLSAYCSALLGLSARRIVAPKQRSASMKRERLTFEMEPELKASLETRARAEDRSVSSLIRLLLAQCLAEQHRHDSEAAKDTP